MAACPLIFILSMKNPNKTTIANDYRKILKLIRRKQRHYIATWYFCSNCECWVISISVLFWVSLWTVWKKSLISLRLPCTYSCKGYSPLTRDSTLTPLAKVHITARGTRSCRSRSSVCIAREGAAAQSWNSYQGLLAPRLQGSDLLFFELWQR